jgi:universal stress protein A
MAAAAESSGRSILCPIDFSDPSRRALRYAAAFAARVDAALVVLYVNDPLLSTAAAAAGYDERQLAKRTDTELRRFVRKALPSATDRTRIRYSTATGEPHRLIVRATREFEAHLIVMGTHGLRGPRKVLLGSTTERTLRDAAVPVVAVPHQAPRRPPRGWPAGPLVAGIDLGPHARSDVTAVAAVARMLGSDLLLVHVAPEVHAPSWFKPRRADDDADLTSARSKLARLAADAAGTDVPVSFRVVRGEPAMALGRVAKRTNAGTLVLVLRPGKGLFGMARGTVTYRTLTSATTAVIALPAGAAASRFVRAWQ